jgi:hypothetical protein
LERSLELGDALIEQGIVRLVHEGSGVRIVEWAADR